jgi:hypothetical protein
MEIAADELLAELTRIEATLDEAAQRAGEGSCPPDFERRLEAHLRSLRSMLGPDDMTVAGDAMEAAERAMSAADPAAPLMMLAMARENLAGVIRRRAGAALRTAA